MYALHLPLPICYVCDAYAVICSVQQQTQKQGWVELHLVQVGATPFGGAVTDVVVMLSHSLGFPCQRCRLGNKLCSGCHIST